MSPSRHTLAGTGRRSRTAAVIAAALVATAISAGSALAAATDSYEGGKDRVVAAGPPQVNAVVPAKARAADDGTVRVSTRLRVSESGVLRVLVWSANGDSLKLDCRAARFDRMAPSTCQQGGRQAFFQIERPRGLRIAVTVAAGEARPGEKLLVRLAYTDRDIPGQPDRSGQAALTQTTTVLPAA